MNDKDCKLWPWEYGWEAYDKNMHKIYQCQRESYICDSVKEKKNTKELVHVESYKKFSL